MLPPKYENHLTQYEKRSIHVKNPSIHVQKIAPTTLRGETPSMHVRKKNRFWNTKILQQYQLVARKVF